MDERAIDQKSVERRAFLRRAAVAAWASPVLVTVMATRAGATHGTGCAPSGATGHCGIKNGGTCVGALPLTCCSQACSNDVSNNTPCTCV